MDHPNDAQRPTFVRPPTFFERLRRFLIPLGVLLLICAAALFAYRQVHVTAFKSARADFESQVGRLQERVWDPTTQPAMEPELEALQEVRQLHAAGVKAMQSRRLDDAFQSVVRIEELRRDYLHDETRLVDLMLAHACGRFGLDLAAEVLESPDASAPQLEGLRETFDAAWDHRGVHRAIAFEAELQLAGHAHVAAIDLGLKERLYLWLHGPADQAAGLRLYAALVQAMYEPVLDVRGHLIESARAESPAFGVVSDFLIVNLQDVPWNHRQQTSGRRLMRQAIHTRLEAASEPALEPLGPDDTVDAVTGGQLVQQTESDGSVLLHFPDALEIQETRLEESPPPSTAPPSVPLRLRLPPPP